MVHTRSSTVRFHTIGHPSGCLVHPWALHHPVTQNATEDWFRELYSNPLTKRSKLPSSTSRAPLGADEWVLFHTPFGGDQKCWLSNAAFHPRYRSAYWHKLIHRRGWIESVLPFPVDWLPVVGVGHSSSYLRHERATCRISPAEGIWYTFRDAFRANSSATPTCNPTKTFEDLHLEKSGMYVF